jgi:diaminopimelate epimerase
MLIEFSKYSGCGNDFIMIDNRSNFFLADPKHIQSLCARRTGIGADGVILLENSAQSDFRMRIFNADGYEAEMCGNGLRCLMKFIQDQGFTSEQCTVETFLRPLAVSTVNDLVKIEMGAPFDFRWDIPLSVDGSTYTVHHINTGVPHLVYFTDALEEFPLEALGPKFRHHPLFTPQGANFNVARLMPNGEVWNRTFERGVEGETLACGTGCTAVAIAASHLYKLPTPIKVLPLSKENLIVDFALEEGGVTHVSLTGPAVKTFTGTYKLSSTLNMQQEFN